MEVWILLAAAGSGYLARKWQNAHNKPRESLQGEAHEERNVAASNQQNLRRGKYRRFLSLSKQQSGKSKGIPHWNRQLLKNAEAAKQQNLDPAKEYHVYGEGFSGTFDQDVEGDQDLSSSLSTLSLNHDGSGKAQKNKTACHGLKNTAHETVPENSHSSLSRLSSGKRANDSSIDKGVENRYRLKDGSKGKRMKDEVDSTTSEKDGSVFGTLMPGFWDVSEGVFVLDTESLVPQQDGERYKVGSARKIRTPNKYGRTRGSRRRSLVPQKPMTSLESCLSAQVDDNYNITTVHNKMSADKLLPSKHVESSTCQEKAASVRSNFAVGLPSLVGSPVSKKILKKTRRRTSLIETDTSLEEYISSADDNNTKTNKQFNIYNKQHGRARRESTSSARGSYRGSSTESILFNFGVGVGIMFTLMSRMREAKSVTLLLKEMESLIQDMENDKTWKDNENGGHISCEQRHNCLKNKLKKIMIATESLDCRGMHLYDSIGMGSNTGEGQDFSVLEAELEAELERMELYLGSKDRTPGSRIINEEVGSLIEGELTTSGLPFDPEDNVEVDDSSESSPEDFHRNNYAVSPRQLSMRLHEVLEARQEDRLLELEAHLKSMESKIQEKEEELQCLKKTFMLSEAPNKCSMEIAREVSHSPEVFRTKRPMDTFRALHSPNASPNLCSYNAHENLHRKQCTESKSTTFITLGGEALTAYQEAFNEFSKVTTETLSTGEPLREEILHGGVNSTKKNESQLQQETSDCLEQVDLFSLAEDFYAEHDDPDSLRWPSRLKRRYPRRRNGNKGSVLDHPQPEQYISGTKGVDSSDDATNDTSGSTPCSIKHIDIRTAAFCGKDDQVENESGNDASSTENLYSNWSEGIPLKDTSGHSISSEVLGSQHRSGNGHDFEDDNYSSELDEQLGQLLIKKIVEKSRKGSPIVQDAQIALAAFDSD